MEQHQEHVKKKINIGIGGNMAFGGWRKTLGDIGHLGLNEKMTGVKSVCHRLMGEMQSCAEMLEQFQSSHN